MVSTLTAAALAKAPIVMASWMFMAALDSVLDYGSNVTASRKDPEGDRHGKT
jgi:hypothetical protein